MIFGIDFDNTIVNYDSVFRDVLKKENKIINKSLISKKSRPKYKLPH